MAAVVAEEARLTLGQNVRPQQAGDYLQLLADTIGVVPQVHRLQAPVPERLRPVKCPQGRLQRFDYVTAPNDFGSRSSRIRPSTPDTREQAGVA